MRTILLLNNELHLAAAARAYSFYDQHGLLELIALWQPDQVCLGAGQAYGSIAASAVKVDMVMRFLVRSTVAPNTVFP